jgi:hypothetical protein
LHNFLGINTDTQIVTYKKIEKILNNWKFKFKYAIFLVK